MATFGFDVETFPIQDGEPIPVLCCLSFAEYDPSQPHSVGATGILDPDAGVDWFAERLDAGDTLIAHNAKFDLVAMLRAAPHLTRAVLDAAEQGRFMCTLTREKLLRISTGKQIKGGLDLNTLAKQYGAGEDRSKQKHSPDAWRVRYNELVHLPVSAWPDSAVEYAIEDSVVALRVALAQARDGMDWRAGDDGYEADPDDIAARLLGADAGPAMYRRASGRPSRYRLTRANGLLVNEVEQVCASIAFELMRVWGLRTDGEAVARLRASLSARADALAPELIAAGVMSPNKKKNTEAIKRRIIKRALASVGADTTLLDHLSTKECVEWMAADGIVLPTTDSGDVTTGQDILEVIDDPVIEALVEYDRVKKKLGTFVPVLELGTVRPITAWFNPLVETGRASCSNPNLTNLPRKGGERECFVARQGTVIVAIDYGTLELRAFAQRCENLGIPSRMAEVMRTKDRDGNWMDVHLMFAAFMAGVSYDTALDMKAGKQGPEAKARIGSLRSVAKPLNFGAPVGMGAEKLKESARKSYGVDFDAMGIDAQEILDQWKSLWTEAPLYFAFCSGVLRDTGEVRKTEVVRADGTVEVVERAVKRGSFRLQSSGRIRGRCGFTDGANYGFQGLASDGAKAALWRVTRECYGDPDSPLWGCRPINFIHDEIMLEAPEHKASAAADRMAQIMREEMERYIWCVPIVVDVALMRRWYKEAESTRNPDGTWTIYERN